MILKNLISTDLIDETFAENSIQIFPELLKLKLLKLRTLNQEETLKNSSFLFYDKVNKYERNNNNVVVISDIILNDFIFNITPYGLKRLKKEDFLGIEAARKRQIALEDEQERKKKEKDKGDPGVGKKFVGPGER